MFFSLYRLRLRTGGCLQAPVSDCNVCELEAQTLHPTGKKKMTIVRVQTAMQEAKQTTERIVQSRVGLDEGIDVRISANLSQ